MEGRPVDRGHRASWLQRLFGLIALGVIGAAFWRFCGLMRHSAITNDWPWLYRTGIEIWHQGLPSHDLLSWTYPERGWVLYQWLFEAIAAPLYALAGATISVFLLSVFAFGLYAAGPAFYLARRGVHPLLTMAIGALVLIPVGLNFALRPMLATLALMALQWVWLNRLRDGRLSTIQGCLGIAVGYALWSNLHLGFTLGLASLLIFAVVDVIGAVAHRSRATIGPVAMLARWAALALTAVVATGANPYGWSLFGYIWQLSHKTAMNVHIHELMPPNPSNTIVMGAIALGAVLVLLCLVALKRRVPLPWTALLHLVLFAGMTSQAIRIIVWAGLAYVVAAAPLIQALWRSYRGDAAGPHALSIPQTLIVAVIVVLVAGPASAWSYGSVRVADCQVAAHAIRVMDERLPADAHWFSSERIGSCTALIAPGRRVFIDTRFDFYPESFVVDWFYAYQHRQNWQALFERWGIDHVLLVDTAPLVPALENDTRFTRERLDDRMLSFTRRPTGDS